MSETAMTFDDLRYMAGRELGVSNWVTVDQGMIDQFAECTRDRQWIHVDVERARRESPFGAPVAHGYLTLSLIAAMSYELGALPEDAEVAINYGLDRVRFLTPVRVGSRVRLRSTLVSFEEKAQGQFLMKSNSVIEIEGEERPALVAETLAMLIAKAPADAEAS